jgi:hydrogenase maturation protease
MKLCILGIGSPSGDDQAGWLVVDALAERADLAQRPDLRIEKLDRPGAALVERLRDADHAILIDAMQSGAAPGTVRHLCEGEWAAYRGGLSSHGFGVFDALALAQALQALPQRLDLYGIEIGSAAPGAAPGAAVRNAAQRLADSLGAALPAGD